MSAGNTAVEIRRHIAAAPEQVFMAFRDPRLIERWLSPSPTIPVTVRHLDFREGGAYSFAYRVPDRQAMVVGGVYRSIVPPRCIVFSWIIEPPDEHAGIESEVTVTITPAAGGSELVIRHEKWTRPDAMTRHADGWRGALDQLTTLQLETEALRA